MLESGKKATLTEAFVRAPAAVRGPSESRGRQKVINQKILPSPLDGQKLYSLHHVMDVIRTSLASVSGGDSTRFCTGEEGTVASIRKKS